MAQILLRWKPVPRVVGWLVSCPSGSRDTQTDVSVQGTVGVLVV